MTSDGAGGGALEGGLVLGGFGTGGADLKEAAEDEGPLVFLRVGIPPANRPPS